MAEPKLIIATHNVGKLAELRDILSAEVAGINPETIVTAEQWNVPDVKEDGTTFAANALLKARAVSQATGLPAVADDSGLAVNIMGGSPGIFSARWSGRHGDDEANNRLLLAQLSDIPERRRGAQFVCAAAFVSPSGFEHIADGVMKGRLLAEPRGEAGFGYDPLFLPDGYDRSAAELSADEKNAISHRGQALKALASVISEHVEF